MAKSRLHDLGGADDVCVERERIGAGYCDRVGPQPAGLEQHPGREMEHLTNATLADDFKIGYRIVSVRQFASPC